MPASAQKTALIIGISGQDGAYLADLLLQKGYAVHGTSRDAESNRFEALARLGLKDKVSLSSCQPRDIRSVIQVLDKTKPDEVYNLAGQSSVGLSFQQPLETLESNAFGTLNLLEALRLQGDGVRLYNAASGDCFGDTGETPANEQTAFRPRSPYAVAKAAAFWAVANYREAYGLHACSGILFNHESPLRPERFVTRKITNAVARIKNGEDMRLKLGDIAISRDWGWAPEYVDAMWRMLQTDEPLDLVIATGKTESLERFIELAFTSVGLDWRDHTDFDQEGLKRPTDIRFARADNSAAKEKLDWSPKAGLPELTERMVQADLDLLKT